MRTFHVILSAVKGLGIKRAAAVAGGGGWTGAERAGGEESARNPQELLTKAPEDAGCGCGRREHPGLCGRRPSRHRVRVHVSQAGHNVALP